MFTAERRWQTGSRGEIGMRATDPKRLPNWTRSTRGSLTRAANRTMRFSGSRIAYLDIQIQRTVKALDEHYGAGVLSDFTRSEASRMTRPLSTCSRSLSIPSLYCSVLIFMLVHSLNGSTYALV